MLRLLLAVLCLAGAGEAITCNFPRCICLQLRSTTYYCNDPVQDLSGFGAELPEIAPGTFSQASFVTNLSLADNAPLILYAGSFEGLTNVIQVDLSGNGISDLPNGVFSPMPSLTSLDLSNNALSSLNPLAFTGLNNLTTLSLGGNMLTQLPLAQLFEAAPNLNAISLFPNPINCSDDNITELFSLARSGVITDADQLFCSNGTKFTELNFDATMTTTMATIATSESATTTESVTTTVIPTTVAMTTTIATTESATTTESTTIPTTVSMTTTTTTIATTESATTTESTTIPTTVSMTTTTTTIATTESATTTESVTTTEMPTTSTVAMTTTTTMAAITTTEMLRQCSAVTTILQTGYYEWPLSLAGDNISISCPYGPPGGVAMRHCTEMEGVWSTVDETQCEKASETTQVLAALSEVPVTPETSAGIASQLAVVTSDPIGITVEELSTVVEIAEQLIHIGRTDVQVLNVTLEAIDSLVAISGQALTQATPQTITNLRDVIDSLLLGALSVDKTDLVLSFTNLAVGGAYLPPTSNGRLLTVIRQDEQRGVESIQVGGANGDDTGDILVDIEGGVVNSSIQITVYNGDELFMESNCSNASNSPVGGVVIGPIISVINEGGAPSNNEIVTIRYNQLSNDRAELVCVRWNLDQQCEEGRWERNGCTLTQDGITGVVLCTCQQQGTYAIVRIGGISEVTTSDSDAVPSDLPDSEAAVTRIVFYTVSTLTQILYITVMVTVLAHSDLRTEPLYQTLVGLSLSQGLTHLLLMLSYELSQVAWVCYSLGLLFHYSTLVTLTWMAALPVVMAIEVFKRLWYEKAWIIAPFAAFSTIWPALPTAIYGGLRYSVFDINSSICWLEASIFPNTFTYLFAFTFLVTMVTIVVTFVLLCCSDYSLPLASYLHVLAMALNTLVFLPSILLTFFTAAAQRFNISHHNLLAATSISALISGAVLFVCLGVCRDKLRAAMFLCRKERDKVADYAATWQEGEERSHKGHHHGNSAFSHILRGKRRRPLKMDDTTNYIDDYLGYTHSNSSAVTIAQPVPLAMLGQVPRQGRVKSVVGGANGAWSQHGWPMDGRKGVWSQYRYEQSSEA